MKHLLLILIALIYLFPLHAQIIIETSDLPSPGRSVAIEEITNGASFNFNSSRGANQIWDYSALKSFKTDTVTYKLPSDSPYGAAFPTSTVAEVTTNNTIFYSVGPSDVYLLGQHDTMTTRLQPPLLYSRLPIAFNNINKGTGKAVIEVPYQDTVDSGLGFPVVITAVRVTLTITKTDTADSWGTIKTPTGEYQALRIVSHTQVDQKIEGKTSLFGWVASPQQPPSTFTRNLNWWAKGIGREVFGVQLDGKSGNVVEKISWYVGNVEPPTAVQEKANPSLFLIGPNPTSGHIQLTAVLPTSNSLPYQIYNIAGKQVYAGTYNGGTENINLSNLPAGVYELKLRDESNAIFQKKLIIVK